MSTTRLSKLTLKGFRSFVDESIVEFKPSGLWLLAGTNLDTKGSSGSGKSSVLVAIAYALGFSPFSATDSQSWLTEKPGSVSLELETGLGPVTITRGKKTSLTVAGEVFKGSIKQMEERIDEIFGLTSEMRAMLTYRGQKKPGRFLSMTDLDRKEFLMRLLGLTEFETALEQSAEKIKALENSVAVATADVTRLVEQLAQPQYRNLPSVELAEKLVVESEAELEATKQRKADLQEQLRLVLVENTQNAAAAGVRFDAQIEAAQAAAVALGPIPVLTQDESTLTSLRGKADEAQKRVGKLQADDKLKKTELEQSKLVLSREIQALNIQANAYGSLKRDKERLEKEVRSLEASLCPTCEREWDLAAARREKLALELTGIHAKMAVASTFAEEARVKAVELEALPAFEPNPTIAKLQALHTQVTSQAAQEQQRLASAQSVVAAEHKQKLSEAYAEVNRLKAEAATLYAAVQTMGVNSVAPMRAALSAIDIEDLVNAVNYAKGEVSRLKSVLRGFTVLTEQHAAAFAKCKDLATDLAAEKDFLGLIGRDGFLGSIFDQVLAEISEETNKILAGVANTRHVTFEFSSENLTQKGTVQRKIVPIITVGGIPASFDSGLSGGQQSPVELAVDLAVGAVVGRRSGATPGFLMLDEVFTGLDDVSLESCFEILKEHSRDRLIIVVDHAAAFKSLFDGTISVTFEGGRSSIAT